MVARAVFTDDHLRCRFAQFNLITHFLEIRTQSFNLLLEARGRRLQLRL
jgi:hypothetical protein